MGRNPLKIRGVMYYWNHSKDAVYEKWRKHWFDIHPKEVADYSWNYLFTGGKEIRPTLFCELWSYLSPDSNVNTELAFAIECIHVASTVLDDTPWMDNANERRGVKTLHTVFSPKKTILIVYDLMNMVRIIWLNNRPSHVDEQTWVNLLKSKLQRLIIGQFYDIEKKGNLIELASLKTGVLFELVTETVALCIQLDREFWKIWGNNLGILFQWMDDWHDQQEDKLQNNRNAFNEAFDTTLQNYSYLWCKLEHGIGKQWFLKEFGLFMKKYFTGAFPISNTYTQESLSQSIIIPYPVHIIVPELTSQHFPGRGIPEMFTGKEILRKLYQLSEETFEVPILLTNLWDIDETQWEEVEEIKHYWNQTKQIDETNWKPLQEIKHIWNPVKTLEETVEEVKELLNL